jgi:hypothetical protein
VPHSVAIATQLGRYVTVQLSSDVPGLTDAERAMLPILAEAADAMDEIYWLEMAGPRAGLLDGQDDPVLRRYAEINAGPWDRLTGGTPFIEGAGPRPPGRRFYPADMTTAELEAAAAGPDGAALRSPYTVVRRDPAGRLVAVPYHVAFDAPTRRAAAHLRRAAALAEQPGLRRYLEARATALETDDYPASDAAWLDMHDNRVELVIGPIEDYEDELFGYRASHEAVLLIKDVAWSERLAAYIEHLPALQAALPVPEAYRREHPGSDAELGAYDAVYLAGDARPGAAIGINLPNDELVQLEKGSRRLQVRNLMRAKYDAVTRRVADVLIAPDQRRHLTFEAIFETTMFHEVAHGLGIKRTVDGSAMVRDALLDWHSPIEEEKADVLGLFMLDRLATWGVARTEPAADRYVSYVADLLRHARFGLGNAYAITSASQLSFLRTRDCVVRDPATGTYRVSIDRMPAAIAELAGVLLMLQGDGDHAAAGEWCRTTGALPDDLAGDLRRLEDVPIPVEVFFDNPPDLVPPRG